jgi:hypothetical protein
MRFEVVNFGHFSINIAAALKKHQKNQTTADKTLKAPLGKQAPQAKPARNKTGQRKPKRQLFHRYRGGEVNLRSSFRKKERKKINYGGLVRLRCNLGCVCVWGYLLPFEVSLRP